MTIRFDAAFGGAIEVTRNAFAELAGAGRFVLVRDLFGRIRAVVEHRFLGLDSFDARLKAVTGRYFAGAALVGDEMVAPRAVLESTDIRRVAGIEVLERGLIGADWTRSPLPNQPPQPPRATLYGLKGGVGRSTAMMAWARHLAARGERVLVIDLDLESPGVSSSLLPSGATDFGVVDWLVEDAIDNADEIIERTMVASSPLAGGTGGEILVAPCGSTGDPSYLAKLSRAYLDVPTENGPRTFAVRLATMVDHLEALHTPTVVLLDSRAGLHDIAAIATTRLDAMTFLFAVGSRQTWDGYNTLLAGWGAHPAVARNVRERLRIVAAQVPETGRDEYLKRLTVNAYDAFEPLYDRPAADGTTDDMGEFNFDVDAADGPHYPLPIYWSRVFQDWNPLTHDVTDDQLRAAFGEFLDAATGLLDQHGSTDDQT